MSIVQTTESGWHISLWRPPHYKHIIEITLSTNSHRHWLLIKTILWRQREWEREKTSLAQQRKHSWETDSTSACTVSVYTHIHTHTQLCLFLENHRHYLAAHRPQTGDVHSPFTTRLDLGHIESHCPFPVTAHLCANTVVQTLMDDTTIYWEDLLGCVIRQILPGFLAQWFLDCVWVLFLWCDSHAAHKDLCND